MPIARLADRQECRIVAASLTIIVLSVVDAFLTLELVAEGAFELNPIMAYYLDRGPLSFFWVKYGLTWASMFLILAVGRGTVFGGRVSIEPVLAFSILLFSVVVQLQLYMKLW